MIILQAILYTFQRIKCKLFYLYIFEIEIFIKYFKTQRIDKSSNTSLYLQFISNVVRKDKKIVESVLLSKVNFIVL